MRALHPRTIPAAVLTLALGWGIAGCSSDEGTTGTGTGTGTGNINPAVVGTWNATSFVVGGGPDLIGQGTTFTFTFILNSNGTYSFIITDDQRNVVCGTGMAGSCTESGIYTASDAQIILDPSTTDEITFNYSISGTTMTLNADINETTFTIVLDKV